MQLCATNKGKDYIQLVNIIGRLYQIRDDYINLKSESYMRNKSYCEDLSEGKFSLPIIHSIRTTANNSSDRQLINILKQRTHDIDLKRYAVQLMESSGSFEYTLKLVRDTYAEAMAETNRLGGNQKLQDILKQLYI